MEPPETWFAGEAGLESTKSQTAARVKGGRLYLDERQRFT